MVPSKLRHSIAFWSRTASDAPRALATPNATRAPTRARTAPTVVHEVEVLAILAKKFIDANKTAAVAM